MKYVIIPQPVQLTDRKTGPLRDEAGGPLAPMTMHDFVVDQICRVPAIGKGLDGARRVRKLDIAFAGAAPGELVGVEDADWVAVTGVLQGFDWSNPLLGAQLLPLMEAFEDARTHDEAWRKAEKT